MESKKSELRHNQEFTQKVPIVKDGPWELSNEDLATECHLKNIQHKYATSIGAYQGLALGAQNSASL